MSKSRLLRRCAIGAAVPLLSLAVVSLPAQASSAQPAAVSAPIVMHFPGRSTIPHLSARLAALAENSTATVAAQDRAAGTPSSGPGSLLRRADSSRVLVDIRVAHFDSAAVARLRAAGAQITNQAPSLRTVTAAVAPSALRSVAALSGVQYVADDDAPRTGAVCDSTISEGDQILHAAQLRTDRGIDGTGVTVGILSDSFDTDTTAVTHEADDVASDNLPGAANTCGYTTDVGVESDYSGGGQEDEGRAMAQIVHDLAPGAKILFATADDGEDAYAASIRALATDGANIIVDDTVYEQEPMFQDGPVADAVNAVRAEGVDYFSMAYNDNIEIGGQDVGSYDAVDGYRPTTCPAALTAYNADYTDCHNFDADPNADDPTYGFTMLANTQVDLILSWAEPEFGVDTDYDLCLMAGSTLVGCQADRNSGAAGSQVPEEVTTVTNGGATQTLSVVVARYGGDVPNTNGTPRFKLVFSNDGDGSVTNFEYSTPTGDDVIGPAIFGHNGTSGAETVAASDVRVTPSAVDSYSSRGPETLLFGPVDGTTPAAPLATPEVLAKPNLTASDCAINTFFGFNDGTNYRFCGTSAAAPHAAAIAALLLQQNPALTPDQLNQALESTATDLGLPTDQQGAGLINAAEAGNAVVPRSQTIAFTQPANAVVGGTAALAATADSGLPVSFSVDPLTSPAGACTISATPGTTVNYAKAGLCVIDADQVGNALFTPAQTALSVIVKAYPAITTKSLPSGVIGKRFSAKLTATGGNLPVGWAVKSGKLPTGLKLATTGTITGTPKQAGTFHVTVAATDSTIPTSTATKVFTIKVAAVAVRTTSLPKGTKGKKYATSLQAYGIHPVRWARTGGSLPPGLSLSKTGKISGKPTKAGTYHLTVRVTDPHGHKATKHLTIKVAK